MTMTSNEFVELFDKFRDKVNEIPELISVVKNLNELSVSPSRLCTIEVTVKDFESGENTRFEKKINRE